MIERPLPPNLDQLLCGYEVDPTLEEMRLAFMRRSIDDLTLFLRTRGFLDVRIIHAPFTGPDGCYKLRRLDKDKAPVVDTIRSVRQALSAHLGIDPAPFYIFLDKHFDREFLQKYRYSFSTRCMHGSQECIRPSHLRLCTYAGVQIPYKVPSR